MRERFQSANIVLSGPRTPESPPKPLRCVLALDFGYPDFFSEFYPDSGGYLEIFGPYPEYDIPQKKIFFFLIFCSKTCPTRPLALHYHF